MHTINSTISTSKIDMEEVRNAMDYMREEVPRDPISHFKVADLKKFIKKLDVLKDTNVVAESLTTLYGVEIKVDIFIPENEVHVVGRDGRTLKILEI